MDVIPINKSFGHTTRQSYRHLTKRYKKIGHVGTLDPFATGLVLVVTDKDTKKADEIHLLPKVYLFDVSWGIETDTYDMQCKTIKKVGINFPSLFNIVSLLPCFIGCFKQSPPLASARWYKGKRIFSLKDLTEKEKEEALLYSSKFVVVKDIRVVFHGVTSTTFYVESLSGFFVRSFAHDLGKKLKCGGFISFLKRVSIGNFSIFV